jgi:hypothetical protein
LAIFNKLLFGEINSAFAGTAVESTARTAGAAGVEITGASGGKFTGRTRIKLLAGAGGVEPTEVE